MNQRKHLLQTKKHTNTIKSRNIQIFLNELKHDTALHSSTKILFKHFVFILKHFIVLHIIFTLKRLQNRDRTIYVQHPKTRHFSDMMFF